jgi:hypothetical protein
MDSKAAMKYLSILIIIILIIIVIIISMWGIVLIWLRIEIIGEPL